MERRDFLKTSLIAAFGLTTGMSITPVAPPTGILTSKKVYDTTVWYLDGILHRMDFSDGTKAYYQPGENGFSVHVCTDNTDDRFFFENDAARSEEGLVIVHRDSIFINLC